MGIIRTGFWLAAMAATGAAYMASDETLSRQPLSPDQHDVTARQIAERFRVVLSGRDTGCHIERSNGLSEHKAKLVFDAGCIAELPDLADARYWSEEEDGSVAFTAESGRVALRFAASDGHAFESYGAGVPMISLIAAAD